RARSWTQVHPLAQYGPPGSLANDSSAGSAVADAGPDTRLGLSAGAIHAALPGTLRRLFHRSLAGPQRLGVGAGGVHLRSERGQDDLYRRSGSRAGGRRSRGDGAHVRSALGVADRRSGAYAPTQADAAAVSRPAPLALR